MRNPKIRMFTENHLSVHSFLNLITNKYAYIGCPGSRNCFRNYTRHLRLCYRRQLGIKKIISKNNHCTAFTSINSLIKTCLSSERCVEVSVKYAHNRPITKTPKDPSRISEARTAKTCSAFRWTFFCRDRGKSPAKSKHHLLSAIHQLGPASEDTFPVELYYPIFLCWH